MLWPDLCHISHSTVQRQPYVRRRTRVTESRAQAGLHTVSGLRMLTETQQGIGRQTSTEASALKLGGRGRRPAEWKEVLGATEKPRCQKYKGKKDEVKVKVLNE